MEADGGGDDGWRGRAYRWAMPRCGGVSHGETLLEGCLDDLVLAWVLDG